MKLRRKTESYSTKLYPVQIITDMHYFQCVKEEHQGNKNTTLFHLRTERFKDIFTDDYLIVLNNSLFL